MAEPEVRQVTLPLGGARLVIASDGLWDAVSPKSALHHVRGMPASKAATELVGPFRTAVDMQCGSSSPL
jgi:serine/threonine protein phosphatase PrpC